MLMKLILDVRIQNESTDNRDILLKLAKNSKLGKNTNVVYIYSLVGDSVNYPIKSGNVIYIGEAGRASEPTGKRFGQHISTKEDTGGDLGAIYALSRYYWLGKTIRLQVFLVESKDDRKTLERDLLNAHVKMYGSLPMCQGTTGGNYKTSVLSNMTINGEHLDLFAKLDSKAEE
jgi:hypothetical protein